MAARRTARTPAAPREVGGASSDRPDAGDEPLSFVAHELRASINTILGWAELFRVRDFDEASRVRAAETIIRHAKHQAWLINELVETWRLASGTLHLNLAPLNLRALLDSAVEAVRPMAIAREVALDLHPDRVTGTVIGDPQRLKLVVVTMLSNALHFVAAGGRLSLRLVPSPTAVDVELQDLGLALNPDSPSTVPDYRSSEIVKAARRLDLGLGLVRGVVEMHGGSVEWGIAQTSRTPLFKLSLPLQPAADARGSGSDRRSPSGSTPLLRGLHVLVVDDESDARQAVAGILTHHGAVVLQAGSTAEALDAIARGPVDVLLADICMPGEDGYDLIKRIRNLDPSVAGLPAAAVTACAADGDRERALQAGFQVHLPKPVDPETLVSTVCRLGSPGAQ